MSRPAPTRDHHLTFCTVENWQMVQRATGQSVKHHVTYDLMLFDGRILRTRISRPADRATYGPSVWSHILRDQLEVSSDEFWVCVQDGILPDRGEATLPIDAIPANLVQLLLHTVGVPEVELRSMTKQQAIERINDYWTTGR